VIVFGIAGRIIGELLYNRIGLAEMAE